jgi:prepilin-type N-terminal cleavage/methylation domain-containing protein
MNVKRHIYQWEQPDTAGGAPTSSSASACGRSGVSAERRHGAFTLIEMLVVIAVIGIVAAISVPAIKNMQKADASAAATRQLLDAVARAHQFAISQRTTVYMVFAPPGFWTDPNYNALSAGFTARDRNAVTNVLDKQLVGYNFVALRAVGDQPGQDHPRYLDEWRSLPDGSYIDPAMKFYPLRNQFTTIYSPPPTSVPVRDVRPFEYTNNIPFPTADTLAAGGAYIYLPFLAFNYQGQLISDYAEEVIPLTRGRVAFSRSRDSKLPQFSVPDVSEIPAGNSTNAYNLIVVDRLTGRASVDRL